MPTKSMFQSSTIWGAIGMIVPVILTFFKVDVGADEVTQGVSLIQTLINDGLAIIGFVITIRGRFKAVKPISFLGG